MADYISCVEATGGGREQVKEELSKADRSSSGATLKGSGSGVVVRGSGAAIVDRKTEQEVAQKIERKYFSGAMAECRKVLGSSTSPRVPQANEKKPARGAISNNTATRKPSNTEQTAPAERRSSDTASRAASNDSTAESSASPRAATEPAAHAPSAATAVAPNGSPVGLSRTLTTAKHVVHVTPSAVHLSMAKLELVAGDAHAFRIVPQRLDSIAKLTLDKSAHDDVCTTIRIALPETLTGFVSLDLLGHRSLNQRGPSLELQNGRANANLAPQREMNFTPKSPLVLGVCRFDGKFHTWINSGPVVTMESEYPTEDLWLSVYVKGAVIDVLDFVVYEF